jgi:ribosomal protein uS17
VADEIEQNETTEETPAEEEKPKRGRQKADETPEAVADEKPKRSRKKAEETEAEEVEAPVVSEEVQAEAEHVEAEPAPEAPVAEEEPVVTEPVAEEAPAEEPAPADEPVAEAEPEPAAEEAPAEEAAPAEEPVAEAEPAADVEAAAAEAEAPAEELPPAPTRGPKPKRKRLPRSQRHTHSKPKREQGGERKPITRLPKPEAERGRDQQRRGVVVSAAMDKTIVVRVDSIKSHPKYKKVIRRSKKFHAHDEQNQAKQGDVVRIVETRPLSKTKRWRLAEILEVAK